MFMQEKQRQKPSVLKEPGLDAAKMERGPGECLIPLVPHVEGAEHCGLPHPGSHKTHMGFSSLFRTIRLWSRNKRPSMDVSDGAEDMTQPWGVSARISENRSGTSISGEASAPPPPTRRQHLVGDGGPACHLQSIRSGA